MGDCAVRAAARWNEGFFRPFERPALAWLAAHMPPWITPNYLTGAGFFGAVVAFIGYAASWESPAFLWVASLGLAVNWFGDSLDGTVARLRRIERPRYGYYLDNSIDLVGQLLVAVGLGLSGYARFDLCLLGLVAYQMMSMLTFIRANVSGIFQISYAAVGPTEVRIGFVVLNAVLIVFPPNSVNWLPLTYPDLCLLAWSSATLVTFLVTMVKQVRELAIEEPPPECAAPLPRRAALETDAGWLGLSQAVSEPLRRGASATAPNS
jgi:archaetidylinositol phosphate synthase